LTRPPDQKRRSHSEEGLDEGAEDEPCPSLRAHAIADAAKERAEKEGQDRCEGKAVRKVEGTVVTTSGLVLESSGKGDSELVATLLVRRRGFEQELI
jgi:hypothetical protein